MEVDQEINIGSVVGLRQGVFCHILNRNILKSLWAICAVSKMIIEDISICPSDWLNVTMCSQFVLLILNVQLNIGCIHLKSLLHMNNEHTFLNVVHVPVHA